MVQLFWQFFKRLTLKLSFDIAVPVPGLYARKMKIYIHIKTCTLMFVAALFIIAQNRNNPNAHPLMSRLTKCNVSAQ